jgi:hypothetical protein
MIKLAKAKAQRILSRKLVPKTIYNPPTKINGTKYKPA